MLQAVVEVVSQVVDVYWAFLFCHIGGQSLELSVCLLDIVSNRQVFEHSCTNHGRYWELVLIQRVKNVFELTQKAVTLVICLVKAILANLI